MWIRFTLVFAAALLGWSLQPATLWANDRAKAEPAPASEAKTVIVPFELIGSRHMVVEVKLNGKGPYRLIFDTGAPTMLINPRIAKDAGVTDSEIKGLFGAGEKTIKTFELGELKIDDLSTTVMDHPTVKAISQAFPRIDGIVGLTFFARYKMTIDYQKREIAFVENGYVPVNTMANMMKLMTAKQGPAPIVAAAGQWGMQVDKSSDDTEDGVNVVNVLPGSAAAAAGLRQGDRLLTIDGRWTDSVADVYQAAGAVPAGREATLTIRRDGERMELKVQPKLGF